MSSECRAALVGIAKDEGRDMFEWAVFHGYLGFDRIIVYDNGSRDDTSRQLARAARHTKIEVVDWPRWPGQNEAYNDARLLYPSRARSNNHTRIALARLGGSSVSTRAASIRATSADSGSPASAASATSASQNTGSRLIEVAWPAIITERLTGPATGRSAPARFNTCAGRR
jgi:hypothetical protein